MKAHAALAASLPPDQFAALLAISPFVAGCDPDEQFEFGLDRLIRGLQAKARPTA